MTMLTAVVGGTPVGYALVHRRHGSKISHLASIAVAPDCSGHGVGQKLLSRAERDALAHGAAFVRLEVRSDNSVARHLYESAGYAVRAVLEDYYEDGTAAVCYEKRIAGTSQRHRKVAEQPYLRPWAPGSSPRERVSTLGHVDEVYGVAAKYDPWPENVLTAARWPLPCLLRS